MVYYTVGTDGTVPVLTILQKWGTIPVPYLKKDTIGSGPSSLLNPDSLDPDPAYMFLMTQNLYEFEFEKFWYFSYKIMLYRYQYR